jgi:hypothetical protein
MQVIKDYNNVSDELIKKCIPELKDGEVATFQRLGGAYNPEEKRYEYGSYWSYPAQDRVKDGKKYITIGVPDEIENEKVVRPKMLIVHGPEGSFFSNGLFQLTKGNVADDEMMEWLFLTDFNESKPDRDQSKTPLFKYVNHKVEAKKSRKVLDELTAALMTASNMGIEEKRSFYSAMNWNLMQDAEVLEANLLQYAKDYPADFLSRQNDKDAKLKSILKGAQDKGIINYVPEKHAYAWSHNSVVFSKLDRDENKSNIDLLAEALNVAKNGGDTIKAITNKYNDALREAAKGDTE